MSILTLGIRKGFIYSLAVCMTAVICFAFQIQFIPYSIDAIFMIQLLSTYLAIWTISSVYEYFRIKDNNRLELEIENSENEIQIKEVFFSKLSHQIRTPLNNMLMITNMLSETELNEKQDDFVSTLSSSTNNLVRTVNEINKITDIDLVDRKNETIPFHIYTTISNTLKLFKGEEFERLNLNLDFEEQVESRLVGDPLKVKQIFINLIENFIGSNNNNNTDISIVVRKKSELKNELILNFTINCSILPSNKINLKYLSSAELKASDIDLTIAKKLIEFNGGELIIEQRENNTNYSFDLTFTKLDDETDKKIEKEKSEKQEARKNELSANAPLKLEDATVLLVEDNLVNQKIVNLSLKKLVKRIDIANNGKEALDKFGSSKFDVILMDVQMPIMDGITATKKIRELEDTTKTHTPIIAITANALSGDKEDCLEAGMNDYISKPFQIEDLIEKMKLLLGDSN
jgi:CheY-like chemotaxis protein